ncbi:hypothetical protein [Alteromonas sp. IB21]|uniref:hypothetical protein n=1 Tax=Alteromonas sp. IB21 TaxID=2779369 RepID=UPI001E52DE98|nr:hypothetical protein [Alteromonas sp. IB21]
MAAAAVVTLLWLLWRLWSTLRCNDSPIQYVLSLTNDGVIRVIDDERAMALRSAHHALNNASADGTAKKIHHTSQLFSWGLCIKVLRRKRKWFEKDYSHLGWILKGECCEADYRRLARAIIFARRATNSRNL